MVCELLARDDVMMHMYLHDKFLRYKMETRFLSLLNKLRRINLLYGSFFS